ncbi:MAG: GspH/FimT family pseudopilin [Rhizobacter sp.]|nr:GspH/FimT family pseudopilin [Rhizobacter sp.]
MRAVEGRRRRSRGVTLIELIVTLALFGVLFGLAIPAFTTWIRNNQIRSVADSLQNGLRLAQNESLRRNRVVVFFLTNAQPSLTATAVTNGRNWVVRYVPQAIDAPVAPEPFVQGGALSETSSSVQVTSSAGITAVCFNASGRLILADAASTGIAGVQCVAGPATFDITQPVGVELRPLRVNVELGGRVRMCDPGRPATSPDGC